MRSPPSSRRARTRETRAESGAKRRPECPGRAAPPRPAAPSQDSQTKTAAKWPRPPPRSRALLRPAPPVLLRVGARRISPSALTRSGTPKRSSRAPGKPAPAQTSRRAAPASGGQWRWCPQNPPWSQTPPARRSAPAWCWCPRSFRGAHRALRPRPMPQPLQHRQRRIGRRGKHLQHAQFARPPGKRSR